MPTPVSQPIRNRCEFSLSYPIGQAKVVFYKASTPRMPATTRQSTMVRVPTALFAAATLLSAFLLFQVQPLIAKLILPWFGGSAAVWTSCMLFFQMALLCGYGYAHWLIEQPWRRQT